MKSADNARGSEGQPAYAAPMVADPQWRDARVVGHMRRPDGTLRWIVERADGTQHRVVALAVGPDWRAPEPSDG